eukprot:3500532-Karenia_brevis.AAC.1
MCGPGGGPWANRPGEKGCVISTVSFSLARDRPTYAASMSDNLEVCPASRQSTMVANRVAPCSMWAVALKSGTTWKP